MRNWPIENSSNYSNSSPAKATISSVCIWHGICGHGIGEAYGHAIRNAPDVRTAVEVMVNFANVFSQVVEECIIDTATSLSINYGLADSSIVYRRQDSEFALAAIVVMLREATDSNIRPSKVQFEHERPRGTNELREYFGVNPIFNQSINALVFDRSVLEVPMAEPDPRIYAMSLRHLSERLAERRVENSIIVRLSHMIARRLPEGVPTLSSVAVEMHLTERTLQRRCSEEGVDFVRLIDQVRHQIAEEHLRNTECSFTELALSLGYSQVSAFGRAFRRWTGLTPTRYRALHQQDHDPEE